MTRPVPMLAPTPVHDCATVLPSRPGGYGSTGVRDGTVALCPTCGRAWVSLPCYESMGPVTWWRPVGWWSRPSFRRRVAALRRERRPMGNLYIGKAGLTPGDDGWAKVGYIDLDDFHTGTVEESTDLFDGFRDDVVRRMPEQRMEVTLDHLSLGVGAALFGSDPMAGRPKYDVRIDTTEDRPDRRYPTRPDGLRHLVGWWWDGVTWRLRGRPTRPVEHRRVLYGVLFDPLSTDGGRPHLTGRVTGR